KRRGPERPLPGADRSYKNPDRVWCALPATQAEARDARSPRILRRLHLTGTLIRDHTARHLAFASRRPPLSQGGEGRACSETYRQTWTVNTPGEPLVKNVVMRARSSSGRETSMPVSSVLRLLEAFRLRILLSDRQRDALNDGHRAHQCSIAGSRRSMKRCAVREVGSLPSCRQR